MQHKSYIQQHPHQEMRRGRAPYASSTGVKASTNISLEFQSLGIHLPQLIHFDWKDEDSDERTIYFAKERKPKRN